MCTKVKSNIEYVEIIKKVLFKIFFECVVEVNKKYFLSIFVVMYSKYSISNKNNFLGEPLAVMNQYILINNIIDSWHETCGM